MTQRFSTLEQLTVKQAADGLVAVTVFLLPELVRDYCRFLESLADFFHSVDHKATIELASLRAANQSALFEDGQRRLAEYRARLVTAFDGCTRPGWKSGVKAVQIRLMRRSGPIGRMPSFVRLAAS